MNNLFFIILFMLFSFGVQADTALCTTSDYGSSLKAPQGDGVIHIVQGRSTIHVEPIVNVSIKLTVFDSKQNIVSELRLNRQRRQVSIDISNYEPGIYTLVAESLAEIQTMSFIIND